MGHHDIPEYLAQLDALELYLQLIPKPHSDHYVGVYGLARIFNSLKVQPTNSNDISYIMTIVRCSHICMRGEIFVDSALYKIMNQHKDVLTRMVVFIEGPLWDPHYDLHTYPRDRKRKRDDKGHDEGRERYGDRAISIADEEGDVGFQKSSPRFRRSDKEGDVYIDAS
ncbi:hypothetical protein Tco_0378976 [Tanacetum coccineum]